MAVYQIGQLVFCMSKRCEYLLLELLVSLCAIWQKHLSVQTKGKCFLEKLHHTEIED